MISPETQPETQRQDSVTISPETPLKPPHKLLGRVFFLLVLLGAVVTGTFTGLLIVYSTDLPEVSELEAYRPSSITELYDDQGKVIGSFALQRRVIANYEDFPKYLHDAIISIE